ncbi:MAG: PKD domain-containing protein [Saprospiraceae bacterium]
MKKITHGAKYLLLLVCLLTVPILTLAQVSAPTIQTCGPDQQFCLTKDTFNLCVELTVTPGLPAPIDYFEIDWGDGKPITTVPGSMNPADQFHDYCFEDFFMTCTYEEEHFVVLETFLEDGSVLNSSFKATFRNPPTAGFSISPATICVGDEACFTNNSCPTEALTVVSWAYGDGTSGLEECHIYNAVGSYEVTLTVENPCGTATVTETLTVIDPAIAVATVTEGVVNPMADTLVVCLGGGGEVVLDGSTLSQNETSYLWNVLTSTVNYNWIVMPPSQANPTISDPTLVFFNAGIYSVVLTVNNSCGQPDRDTLIFKVLDAEALTINDQADACLEIPAYQPNPFNPLATYRLNGIVIPTGDFPLSLGVGDYALECSLMNECGMQILTDSFVVFPQEDVTILSNDTTLCVGTEMILLGYTPLGGDWSGSSNIVIVGDSVWYNPQTIEVATLTYGKGIGDCRDTETITIMVVGVAVSAEDQEKCSWSESFVLEATPVGGTWSSTDCPTCIVADTFVVSTMHALGLTSVVVDYNVNGSGSAGCDGATSIVVTIADPIASFTAPDTICQGEPLVVNTTGTIADILLWRVDNIVTAVPPFSTLSTGNHTIEMVAIIGECRDSMMQTVVVAAPPSLIDFTATPVQGCGPLEVILENLSQGENLAFEWRLDGTVFSTAVNPGSITLAPGLSDTSYTISLAVGNGCGGDNVNEVITVFPVPIANFGTDKIEYCSGDTVHFSNVSLGLPDSIFWDFGNGMTATDFFPPGIIYFADTIPVIYEVELIAINSCGRDTIRKDIIINPTDVTAFFNTNPTTACVGEEICFESFSTPGANLLFDLGDGNTTAMPAVCHTYTTPGTYKVTLKAFGCGFDSTFILITVLPNPTIDILNTAVYCPQESIQFECAATEVVDFFWEFGDGNISTLNHPVHSYVDAGIYTVKVRGVSINGCSYEDSVLINVITAPVAQMSISTDSICVDDMVDFTSLATGNIVSCFWAFGDGNTSNDCTPVHSYTAAGNFTVSLVVTNNNGCLDTINQLITVFDEALPDFTFTLNQACSPVELTINNLSTNATSYLWDFGNGEMSTATNPVVTYLNGGTFTIQLTAINGICSRNLSIPVIIRQTPDPVVALSDNAGCAPHLIDFGVTVAGNDLSYTWDFDDGTNAFGQNVAHVFQQPGNYEVSLLVELPSCKDSIQAIITIHEPVEASAQLTDVLCYGDATGAIDITVNQGTAPFQFVWSNATVLEDPMGLMAGTYQLTIVDNNSCIWLDTLTINQADQLVAVVSDSTIVSCFDGFDGGLCVAVSGGVEPYNLVWSNGVSNNNCLENVAAADYQLTITDANNCEHVEVFLVKQHPEIELVSSVTHISCFGFDDGLIELDTISGGVSDLYTTILEGPVSYEGGTSFPNLSPGSYHLEIEDLNACLFERDFVIAEPDSLWIDIPVDSLLLGMGEAQQIQVNHNAVGANFSWMPVIGLDCEDCEDPFAGPLKTTFYSVVLTDENDCEVRDTALVEVELNRKYYIPNTFTPNGDGRNDVFRIRSRLPSIEQVNVFRIYDRWGATVFESKNFPPQEELLENAWDGTFKGDLLPPDVFSYYAEIKYLDGETELVKGTVTLIR